jgi:cytochrome P450
MGNLTTDQRLAYDPIYELTKSISPAMSILITTVCVFLLAFFSSFLKLSRRNPPIKLPPGPKGLPILGNLLQVLGAQPHRALTALQREYGHLLFVRLGSVPTIVVDTAELIEEITKEQDAVFSSRPHTTFTEIVAYDAHDFAMAPYGVHWRHVRRICVNELLTPKRLESTARERQDECMHMVRDVYTTTVTEAAAKKAEGNGDGKVKKAMMAVVDMRDVFAGVSMNVMCRMLLGRREFAAAGSDPKDFKHLIHELFRLMGALNLRDFVPVLGWLDLQGFERDMRQVT